MPIKTIENRLFDHVEKGFHWVWTGFVDRKANGRSYPHFAAPGFRKSAAVAAWLLAGHALSEKERLRRTCAHPLCVKPEHHRAEVIAKHRIRSKPTFEDKFWARVRKRSDDGCWDWKGALNGFGYGTVTRNGKSQRAHRVAYELLIGKIPEGVMLTHKCNNPGCVNPREGHVVLGSARSNVRDAIERGSHVSTGRLRTVTEARLNQIRAALTTCPTVAGPRGAARKLGITADTAYRWKKRLGI